jgi:four helix bundle protein
MEKARSFEDLIAWQESHKFILEIYRVTENFPQKEAFGITNQMRRAAVSITSNIAEGFARKSEKEKIQFYHIALGSLEELRSQMKISADLEYCTPEINKELELKAMSSSRLLNALIKSIQNR